MEMEAEASRIISKLNSSDLAEIHNLFSSYLRPISLLCKPKPKPKPKPDPDPSSIRTLAKTYLPFIRQSLTLLSNLLSSLPKHSTPKRCVSDLLDSYALCLDSLDALSSVLAGKPYAVLLQKARLITRLVRWDRFEEAVELGFAILKALGGLGLECVVTIGELVPRLVDDRADKAAVDCEFVQLVVNVVVNVVAAVAISKTKEDGRYSQLLVLVNEVRPLFRYLDDGHKEWLKLLAYMKNSMRLLVKEAEHFEEGLIHHFCKATFDEYILLLNSQNSQDVTGKELEEFVEFVSDNAYKCLSASPSVRMAVALHMEQSAHSFSKNLACFSLIQRLYAMGLCLCKPDHQSNDCCSADSKSTSHTSSTRFLPKCGDKLEDLSALLASCKKYFCVSVSNCDKSRTCEQGDFVAEVSPYCKCDHKASRSRISENGAHYLPYFLNGLKFLCRPLAEFVISQCENIVAEKRESAVASQLKPIHEALLEYCSLHLNCQSREKGAHGQIGSNVIRISVAAFTLSLKLNFNIKGGKSLLKYLLSDNYIQTLQPNILKYTIGLLNNIFCQFYNNALLKQASKVAKLRCTASWGYCLLLCEMLVGKLEGSDEELSETLVIASLDEARKASLRLMNVLHQLDVRALEKVIVFCLEKWSLARNLFKKLPSPAALIKCWVEIQCNAYQNTDASALILGSYLMRSPCLMKYSVPNEIVGIVLEEELLGYQTMGNVYSEFSQRMQAEIIDILLKKIYNSKNSRQRANVLVRKGKLYRAQGIESLENCINCLSQAIESIKNSSTITAITSEEVASMSHQLAIIYCLRAICTQEANPISKDMLHDIRQAVNLWLAVDIPDCLAADGLCDMDCEYVLSLLYHIADLLSLKGETMIHLDVFKVIIRVMKRMDISLGKCLSLMWESRRFNHALCVVPVSEAYITALSVEYGKDAESLGYWISSMKESQPLFVGFLQNFSYLSSMFPGAFHQHIGSLCSEISVDEVKKVASDLMSQVPVSKQNAFLAAYLYRDLSEWLSASGQMIEALFYAKEARRLCKKLFDQHFSYSIETCDGKQNEAAGKTIRKALTCFKNLRVLDGIAMRAWPGNAISQNSKGFILTQWNALRCYLESTMKVGIIHEALGNENDAEAMCGVGKDISCLQGLPTFSVAFSSCLGKIYLGRHLLDDAHLELGDAEKILASERNFITCSRCLLILESSIMEQRGTLYTKGGNSYVKAVGSPYEFSIKRLISLDKGDLTVWLKESDSIPANLQDKTEAKRSRRVKKASESVASGSSSVTGVNSRVTRSRKQASRGKLSGCPERVEDVNPQPKQESEAADAANKVNCQKCFSDELRNHSSVSCVIQMKWEFIRRREILRLLVGLGKYEGASAGILKLHTICTKCISVLMGGNDCKCSSSFELEHISKQIPGDVLAVDRAEICYDLSWLSLKVLYSKDIRSVPHGLCHDVSQVVSLLMLSVVLSREVPRLFEKVSRLLALTFVVSSVRENLGSPLSSSRLLSGSYWAAYFHQASIGAHHNVRLLSANAFKHKAQLSSKTKDSEAVGPISLTTDMFTLLRVVPSSVEEIEACVENFFKNLPSTTIVCISLLEDSSAGLLEELCPSTVCGWMLLSHLKADNQPGVILLPLSSILQGDETSSSCSVGENHSLKEWHAPWGCKGVIDDVAPQFRKILRENYASSSDSPHEDTDEYRKMWWSWRDSLDNCLLKLLRDMEESWFGAWRYLLLGRWLECSVLTSVVKELVHKIKLKYKYKIDDGVLKLVLGGIKPANLQSEGIPSLFLRKGCYVGLIEDCDRKSCDSQDNACDGADNAPAGLIELMLAAVDKLEAEYCTRREPVILVLDNNVQMLPLESMPILREEEVYRMPSVAIISATLHSRSILEKVAVGSASRFPLVDPLDAFYLVNPSGDLSRTQAEFEEWFRLQNMQGIAGVEPSKEELVGALGNHDLFYYFGHGSGSQYIPNGEVQKLEKCAAMLLMGCSSGSLVLHGDYPPAGPSLSYILAGSPIVVANLWEVTDTDIDRFGKAMIKALFDERAMSSSGCIQCSMLAEEFKSLTVKGSTKKGRGGRRKKPDESEDDGVIMQPDSSVSGYCFRHKLRAGYFVSRARKACKLQYLIGAAPVCYGVPTGITKKTALS